MANQEAATVAIPDGMVEVSKNEFFEALKADPRDIMPHALNPCFSTWETKDRQLWGITAPGWKNLRTKELYAVIQSAAPKAS